MAVDATKLRRRIRRLGEPPTDSNPELSEHEPRSTQAALAGPVPAPYGVGSPAATPDIPTANPPDAARTAPQVSADQRFLPTPAPIGAPGAARYPDGRSRRRTGRIEQINVKVSAQFNADLRGLADRQGLLIVEVLEKALDAYLRVVGAAETSGRSVAQILEGLR
jgi:hypothetical protein